MINKFFYPQIQSVVALQPYKLMTKWDTGEELQIDVLGFLNRYPSLSAIKNIDIFNTVHISDWGDSIEWFDTELGQDNAYALAKEQAGLISHQMFDTWIRRNELSLTTAADALGLSRRMVSYYRTAQKAIPKTVWLACLGWELTVKQPVDQD